MANSNLFQSLAIKIIFFIYKKIRGRSLQTFNPKFSKFIFSNSCYYVSSLFRGIFKLRRFILVGRNVRFLSKKNFIFQNGCKIDDGSIIDARVSEKIQLGSGVSIGAYTILRAGGSLANPGEFITIYDNVGIGDFSHIGAGGGIEIREGTIIGPYFSAHPENHNISDNGLLIRESGVTRKGITIGKNCWIGAKVTILDGVSIGDNSVIAANTLVNKSYPPGTIIAGSPSKSIGTR